MERSCFFYLWPANPTQASTSAFGLIVCWKLMVRF